MTPELVLDWVPLLPATALLVLALYIPGTGALLLLGTRTSVAITGGPLLTAALLGAGGVVFHQLGVRYDPLSFLGLTALLWGVALLVRRLLRRDLRLRTADSLQRREHLRILFSAKNVLVLLGASVLGLGSMWLSTALMIDPHMPNPRVDPMYHYNALNAIVETGTVSMFSAVDFTYGVQVRHVTYPTIWHAITVLAVPAVGIVPAAGIVSYLVTPVVFVVNVALLARTVFRRQLLATAVGAIAAGMFPAFAGGLAFTKAFWPNGLAVAMLPGLLVVVLMFLRRCRWGHIRRQPVIFLLDLGLTVIAAAGLGLTHPSVFFSFVVVALPLLASTVMRARRVVRRTLPLRAHSLFLAVLIIVVLAVTSLLLVPDQVRSFLLRESVAEWDDFLLKGVSMVSNWPTDVSKPAGVLTMAVYVPVILMGMLLLARHRERRWITWAWGLQLAIILGAYFPVPFFSGIAGLWYADTFRLYAIQASLLPLAVVAVVLWAHGKDSSANVLPLRLRKIWAWGVIAAALGGNLYITVGGARPVGVGSTAERPVESVEEDALIERVGDELPEGTLVIGDPASGAAYIPLFSDVESVFTQINVRDVDEDGRFLLENFDRIHEDPRVCNVLEHYGIGYFYEDEPFEYNYSDRAEAMPGFYDVDTSQGFTLVDEGGDARLWRIDACGPIAPPGEAWWNREDRLHPYITDGGGGATSRQSVSAAQ